MKKLVVLGVGAVAASSIGLLSAGGASSDPAVGPNQLNVIGEPYYKAVSILKGMGVKTAFGGAVGSALPQAQCMVDSQKMNSSGKMMLNLDCTEEAAVQMAEQGSVGGPGGRSVGSNGVTTVTPTSVPMPAGPAPVPPPPA